MNGDSRRRGHRDEIGQTEENLSEKELGQDLASALSLISFDMGENLVDIADRGKLWDAMENASGEGS